MFYFNRLFVTFFFFIIVLIIPLLAYSQIQHSFVKIPINHDVYDSWKSLTNEQISCDGKWVNYVVSPQKGNGKLFIVNTKSTLRDSFERGYDAKISPENNFLVYKIKPQLSEIRKAKLDKCKKIKMPNDSLGIYLFATKSLLELKNVKSYKLAKEASNWLCILYQKPCIVSDSVKQVQDNEEIVGTDFEIFNPINNRKYEFNNITDYVISDKGNQIAFVSFYGVLYDSCKIYLFNTDTEKLKIVYNDFGKASALAFDKKGKQVCFIHSADTTDNKVYSLYYCKTKADNANRLIDTITLDMPKNYSVSSKSNNWFSKDGRKLFFEISKNPEPIIKDTLLADEKVSLDIWHWQDSVLQPEQLKNIKNDKNTKFRSVWHFSTNNMVQICDDEIRYCHFLGKGDVNYVFGMSTDPYLKEKSWDANSYRDAYVIDLLTGKREIVVSKKPVCVKISPKGKYVIWYDYIGNAWHTYNIQTHKRAKISGSLSVEFQIEEYDKPMIAQAYGVAGWSENDEFVYIYDKYDIWKMDAKGKSKPIILTSGREEMMSYRIVKLDKDKDYLDLKNGLFLKSFNEKTKGSSYLELKNSRLKKLYGGNYKLYSPQKAKNADKLIWSRMTFTEYPDVWVSDIDFKTIKKISNTNPQQNKYLWGSVELVDWQSGDERLEGLLYRPENFDPNKKYPMIVYFYEKYSGKLNNYYSPKPSRSVINFTYYVSNGYFVFVPDITYKEGYPGQSAVEDIISGTNEILKRQYIDKNRLGVQGQSWGGYQVAYLVTKSNLFAAAMAGAPVSNMTSAYGGIRWGSGRSRMFQYEGGQSRLGASLWENRDLYIENSPLFFADKIETPLLIMHNDNDEAVPWYQGIELFVALRRLNKTVFLLNYNGESHNLKRRADCIDLTKRMQQYFDYYLKDAPIPEWMAYGIPAIKKGKNDGFELLKLNK